MEENSAERRGFPFFVYGGKNMINIQAKTPQRIGAPAAAKLIGISAPSLCIMRKNNRGPEYYKIGGRYYYNLSDIDAWIESCKVDPRAAA